MNQTGLNHTTNDNVISRNQINTFNSLFEKNELLFKRILPNVLIAFLLYFSQEKKINLQNIISFLLTFELSFSNIV